MSLRIRLLLAAGLVALISLLVAGGSTYSALHSFLDGQIDQDLQTDLVPLESALLSGQSVSPGTVGQIAPGAFVEVRSSSGQDLESVPSIRPGGQPFVPALPTKITVPAGGPSPGQAQAQTFFTTTSTASGGPRFRVSASSLFQGDELIVALPLSGIDLTLARLALIEAVVAGGALVVALVIGWYLVRAGLRPLAEVETTAGAITEGELDRRVPGARRRTEVGRLAAAFNAMLDRIQEAFAARDQTEAALRASEERLRRFVADASHELRTPVAAVSAYAELFERGADRRPDDLARAMAGIRAETTRMRDLVEDLLLLARLDDRRPLESEAVELVGLCAEAVQAAQTLGPAWPAHLEAELPVEVTGDAARLRQVVDNLLGNVRAHTPPGISVEVRVRQDGDRAVIEVSDDGPGMAPEHLDHLFERFYRAESSRSRQYGGAGLGLAIVAGIVDAHHGSVSVSSSPGAGTTFCVSLPLTQPGPLA